MYPGRMITTGCGAYLENLSALTAYELKKAMLEYRIVDTPHFLRNIDSLNDSNILLGKEVIHVAIDQESTKASASASASAKLGRFSKLGLGLGLGQIEQSLAEFQINF